jgi:hypothetical protein
MTTAGVTSIAGALGSALSNLSPLQLFQLGHHLLASDEAKAMAILASMNSPAMAAALVGSLSGVPNLPPEVLTWVSQAIQNPANFGVSIANATAALQRAVVAPGILGGLGL